MDTRRYLAVPAYLVASLLALFPLVDTALSILPLRVGEVSWRFGATGLVSRALMTPLLGVLLAFAVALLLEHRRVLRTISVLMGVAAAALVGAFLLFVLDFLQMRGQVNPQARVAFDVASLVALGKYALGLIVALAFAVAGWKASRRGRAAARRGHTAPLRSALVGGAETSA